MSNPLREFWALVREIEEHLPPVSSFWLTPLHSPTQLVEADRKRTAIGLAEGSHRIADSREIAEYLVRRRTLNLPAAARSEVKTSLRLVAEAAR